MRESRAIRRRPDFISGQFPAAAKVLRLPQQKVPRCGHPMSLHQTPYVFSLKTCAPTRYTPVYPPDTHLCTHLIHTCVPKAPPPRYGTFEIGYGTLIELSSDFLKLIRDFEVSDTRLSRPRYGTPPSAIPDFAVRDLRHAARACRRIPPMPSQPPHPPRHSNVLSFHREL